MTDAMDRFNAKTQDGPNGCIDWTGCRQPNGYGKLAYGARTYLAHRWIYEQTHGVTLEHAEMVLHSCDRRCCVNIKHLRVGTAADNVADMDARGRRVRGNAKGEANGIAKLTEADVVEIRRRRATGETLWSIAGSFGVTATSVSQIARRKLWNHVA